MKKGVALFLVICLLVGLTACGEPKTESSTTTSEQSTTTTQKDVPGGGESELVTTTVTGDNEVSVTTKTTIFNEVKPTTTAVNQTTNRIPATQTTTKKTAVPTTTTKKETATTTAAPASSTEVLSQAMTFIQNNNPASAYALLLTIKDNKAAVEQLKNFAFLLQKETSYNYVASANTYADYLVKYTYDSNGNILKKYTEAIKPEANVWYFAEDTYSYDKNGNLLSAKYSNGKEEKYTYDTNGNVISYTDTNGDVTTYEYNKDGAAVIEKTPDGEMKYYDAKGLLFKEVSNSTRATRPICHTTEHTYNADNKLLESNYVSFYIDNGEILSSKCLAKNTYDKNGNILTETKPASNLDYTYSYTYDAKGNILTCQKKETATGTLLESSEYTYNADGKVIKENYKKYSKNYTENEELARTYDAYGRMVTYSSNRWYDANGTINNKTTYNEKYTYGNDGTLVGTTSNYQTVRNYTVQYFPDGVPADVPYIFVP